MDQEQPATVPVEAAQEIEAVQAAPSDESPMQAAEVNLDSAESEESPDAERPVKRRHLTPFIRASVKRKIINQLINA